MKRTVLFILLGCSIVALASAKGRDHWGFPQGMQPVPAEAVTVTGNLTIAQGTLAVKNGDITYLVPGLNRFVGFIDTLKDGARVTLQGSAVTSPADAKTKSLWVTKLTIGGKDYELAQPATSNNPQPMGFPRGRGW